MASARSPHAAASCTGPEIRGSTHHAGRGVGATAGAFQPVTDWTPTVCRRMAFRALFGGFGPLLHLSSGVQVAFKHQLWDSGTWDLGQDCGEVQLPIER